MSAAAPTPSPPATPPEGISREEFEQLQKRLKEFEEAAARLSDASTAAEEERREREAREAAGKVEQTAQRIGLSPADVGEIRGWIRSETKAAITEALDEIAEVRRTEEPAAGGGPAGSLAELADDPTRAPPAAEGAGAPPASPPQPEPAPPAPETPPVREHWFHRPIGGAAPEGDAKP